MQALRQIYKNYQQEAYAKKPINTIPSKILKSVKLAEDEIIKMQNLNDYTAYDETVFYKEKFEGLYDISSKYENKKIPKQIYQQQVRNLLARDYTGITIVQSQLVETRRNKQPITEVSGRQKTKSPLKEFFDEQQVKNSKKVTFSNLLSAQETPLKYGLRSTFRSRSPSNLNDLQVRRLREQNERLRNRLESEKSVSANSDQYRELKSQIGELSQENRRLKQEAFSKVGTRSDYFVEEEYEPYNIKVRENNIMRINSRNLTLSEKSSQLSEYNPQPNAAKVYFDNQSQIARSSFTHNPHHSVQRWVPTIQPSQQQLMNISHSTIQTQFLNLDQSQIGDEQKNHICRQKIGFFKKSMVLYKGQEFDIAFKRSELNVQLDRLRIILYINNKQGIKINCMIQYDYQRDDFDLILKRKLETIPPKAQGREEIELHLRNATDLGSLVTAKILVGSAMKKIILPAMFIDFDPNYRYQFQNIGYIERNLTKPLVIRPMGQFSTIQNTSNVIELTRDFENSKYPVAKLYGKSKVTKGIVKLTWKVDKLKIETCEQWRTLMGYLFLNASQTVQY